MFKDYLFSLNCCLDRALKYSALNDPKVTSPLSNLTLPTIWIALVPKDSAYLLSAPLTSLILYSSCPLSYISCMYVSRFLTPDVIEINPKTMSTDALGVSKTMTLYGPKTLHHCWYIFGSSD